MCIHLRQTKPAVGHEAIPVLHDIRLAQRRDLREIAQVEARGFEVAEPIRGEGRRLLGERHHLPQATGLLLQHSFPGPGESLDGLRSIGPHLGDLLLSQLLERHLRHPDQETRRAAGPKRTALVAIVAPPGQRSRR